VDADYYAASPPSFYYDEVGALSIPGPTLPWVYNPDLGFGGTPLASPAPPGALALF